MFERVQGDELLVSGGLRNVPAVEHGRLENLFRRGQAGTFWFLEWSGVMSGRVADKVVFITGGGGAQGAVEAELFAAEGASVIVADVRRDAAETVVEKIRAAQGRALTVSLDVSLEDSWQSAVGDGLDAFGRIDVLVNNAAVLSREGIETTSLDAWERTIAVNQTGVWLGMKAVLPVMKAAGGGAIVNISSVDGIVGKGSAAAYQATKAAVRLLTKTAAVEYAPYGIRVNTVCPGLMNARMKAVVGASATSGGTSKLIESLLARTPLGRMADPEDVAYGVLYLASDEARYVTGTDLVIDGGYTAQ